MTDIGSALRNILYWNPEPLIGKLGGTGNWSNKTIDKTWSEDANHEGDNVAFSGFDDVVFPFTDEFGNTTRSDNLVRVSGGVVAGNIGGSKDTVIVASGIGGGSMSIASGADISHTRLTLDGVLVGNTNFTVTGEMRLQGTTAYTGRMTLDESGAVYIEDDMTGGADFKLLNGDVYMEAGSRLSSSTITMDRTGLSTSTRSTFEIEGADGNETTFGGRVRMTGDNTEMEISEHATFNGPLSGTAIQGFAGAQRVDIDGEGARLNGAVRLGDDADSFQIYEGVTNGFVSMGEGRDYISVDGNDNARGTLNGNVQFDSGADDLAIYEAGRINGNVAMGADDDEAVVYGTLNGALRLGTGNDEVTLYNPTSVLTGKLLAQGGDDTIILKAGTITASVVLGSGNDRLQLEPDASVEGRILAGGGDDTVQGGTGDDRIIGSRGADSLAGGADNDRLIGNGDNDTLKGEAGDDVLIGGGGDDLLEGGSHADRLDGGAGNDTLDGGTGGDEMTGGSGADRFVFSEIWVNGPGEDDDQILDFSASDGDRIDLSGIDAITATAGDDAFTFSDSFTGTAGELIADGTPGGLYVRGDVDGDGVGDLEIFVAGATELVAGDFIL